ncbi:hypothetical protein AOQ84DRAFT_372497 [Glonium stellatum]|uniref:Uncharacterized protein n=1 Tax=Glonium stellatum TaxID=574774 RepID=A0A8E2JXQ8_9PEZI|nr:hypothetical protein AOQ84DRAFT_372497 [Glonium stellatum]
MAYAYLISKTLDPLFAIGVGAAAAAARINREEKAKGRTMAETVEVLKRRVQLAFGNDTEMEKK